MSARADYPVVERGVPQWEAMVGEIDALRYAAELRDVFPLVLTGFPAQLGKGDSYHDASTGGLWEVASVDVGVVWVPVDLDIMPNPDSCPSVYLAGKSGMIHMSTHGWINVVNPPTQEVTAMQPITDTRFTVTSLAFKVGDPEVHVIANDATATPTGGGWVPNFQFKCPVEMAPRIGEVITMSWGDPL